MRKQIIFTNQPPRKLFFSVLVPYLLLLAVTISLLVSGYLYCIQQSRQDMEALQISYLGQIRRELDTRLTAISKISQFLASQPFTVSVLELSDEQVAYQTYYRSLNEIITEQNGLIAEEGETAIYCQTTDSVLTGMYRYRSVNLNAYTEQLGFTCEEFRDFISSVDARGTLRILHPGTTQAELIYLVPVYNGLFDKVGTVITRLSISYLKDSLNISHWLDGSICHMQSEEESLYIDDGGYGDTISGDNVPDYSQVPLDASPVETSINGETYITLGLPSTVNTWKYYFSIPSSEFFHSDIIYLIWFGATLLLSLLSGVVLSLMFTLRFSKPLQKILTTLQLNTSVAYPEAVNSLESAVISYRNELSATRNQLLQGLRQKRAEFVYGLCSGQVSPAQLEKGVKLYHLTLEDGPVYLIQFGFRKTEKSVFAQNGVVDMNLMLFASCNVTEELLCRERGVVVSHEGQNLCLYQPWSQEEEDSLRKTLATIREFHQNVLHVELQIICAGRGNSLADLPELLSRTEEMAHYKAFWDDDIPEILFYDEIEDLTNLKDSGNFLGAEKRFINLLAIKDYEGAHQVLVEHLDSGISKDMKRYRIERFKVVGFITSLLETFVNEFAIDGDELDCLNAALRDLMTEQSLSGLRDKIDKLFQVIIAHQEKSMCSDVPGWVQDVRSYIENHYDDPQLGVSLLAKNFSLNVSYLSRTYKKVTSIGVLDNIHMVRIAKAKELLDRKCSVQQAAIAVGYLESRALIRTFKRYEGITPGQYQDGNKPRQL